MDAGQIHFREPLFLWLLFIPVSLFVLWCMQIILRKKAILRYREQRTVPVAENFRSLGSLALWFWLIAATSACILALGRPERLLAFANKKSVDLVFVLDSSASMRVQDAKFAGKSVSRWQKSVYFLRTAVQMLNWRGDRLALALFSYQASPQVRLTKDPNVFLFFIDQMDNEPPIPLWDDTAWDTNIQEGIYWAIKIIKKDMELYGVNKNPQGIVVISDGQNQSGELVEAVKSAAASNIPVYTIGVGTVSGGYIPDGENFTEDHQPRLAKLDRQSLMLVAGNDPKRYFELDSQSDVQIAVSIIRDVQRRAGFSGQPEPVYQELYWYFLAMAAGLAALALCFWPRLL